MFISYTFFLSNKSLLHVTELIILSCKLEKGFDEVLKMEGKPVFNVDKISFFYN